MPPSPLLPRCFCPYNANFCPIPPSTSPSPPQAPQFSRQALDVPKLWRLVSQHGGYDQVGWGSCWMVYVVGFFFF